MFFGPLTARCCAFFGLLVVLASCDQANEAGNRPTTPAAIVPTLATAAASRACGEHGRLQTELFGALVGHLDWSAAELECSGMPRPDGAGARFRFAGQVVGADRRIAIIIALPGLERDAADAELGSKVTLIDEGSGRFFSTWDLDSCWTDITSLVRTDDSGDRFNIGGTLYCVAPLAEVNGDASVSISELIFAGVLDWSDK